MSYAQQLKHPKWQKKRLEVLEAAGWACEWCGDTETTFHVHHKQYRKGAMAWEYAREELAALCEKCHSEEHEAKKELDALLAEMDVTSVKRMVGYAKALFAMSRWDREEGNDGLTFQFGSYEEAEGASDAYGLNWGEESLLFGTLTLSEMFSIEVAAQQRRIARKRRGEFAKALADLCAIGDAEIASAPRKDTDL